MGVRKVPVLQSLGIRLAVGQATACVVQRRLRAAENRALGDTTTLADPAVVSEIQERATTEQSTED